MSGNKNKLIAFNYFGGKFTWIEYLYAHFPENFTHLVDVFSGSSVVGLNYKGRVIKTANEINDDITNFFQVLREHEGELVKMLLLTPCSKLEYENCFEISTDPVEKARRFYVRVRQSFYGLGAQRKNKGWHMAKTKVDAFGGETVRKWNNAIEKLHEVAEVIRNEFQITNLDYSTCIEKLDFNDTFFYCDPPYPFSVRSSKDDYKYEFSDDDHINLSQQLHSIKGKAMVSSYNSELYNELYNDWYKVEFPIKQNSLKTKSVQEIIWMNYDSSKKGLFNNL